MITRKVDKDDSQAGFTYNWVKKIGQKVEVLKVICLEKGNIDGLPENIEVFSMGKEKGKKRWKEFINFQRGAWRFIRQVDGVFCHMNPEYTILIAPYVWIFRKKIISWYSHKVVNWRVRLLHFLADKVITPTKQGFGIESEKKMVVGHGIDTELFKPDYSRREEDKFRIISVGRFSPIKDYETLVSAIEILKDKLSLRIDIFGGVGLPSQLSYFEKIQRMVKEKELQKIVNFNGWEPNRFIARRYQVSNISINLCPTGSPDKAVLESMACGLPVLVCNQTFVPDLGPYVDQLLFKEKDSEDLAQKIINLAQKNTGELNEIGSFLRQRIVEHHNLNNLIERIVNEFEKLS